MVDIAFSMVADVEDGPTISLIGELEDATAYAYVDIVVPAEETVEVDIHPGDTGEVALFAMYSNVYDTLSFTVDGGSAIRFTGPLWLVGGGPVSLLGATCNSIAFVNGSLEFDARIRIIAAWIAENP